MSIGMELVELLLGLFLLSVAPGGALAPSLVSSLLVASATSGGSSSSASSMLEPSWHGVLRASSLFLECGYSCSAVVVAWSGLGVVP